jgi:hypothetical protein
MMAEAVKPTGRALGVWRVGVSACRRGYLFSTDMEFEKGKGVSRLD